MMQTWIYTIGSVFLVSLISLVGVFTLSLRADRLKKILVFLVSFAAGALFGDALIHLIPESFERIGTNLNASVSIAAGIMLFFALEKFLRWQHCHIPASSEHSHHAHPVVALNLVGDAVHNLVDGMIIAASFLVSVPIGITTTLAVLLHEIPQEIGDFAILIHGGLSVQKALFFNFLSALAAFVGAIIFLVIGPYIQAYVNYLLPVTAGGFLYIAGSDLIPELHHGSDVKLSTSLGQFLMIILGIAVMAALVLIE